MIEVEGKYGESVSMSDAIFKNNQPRYHTVEQRAWVGA